PAPRGVVQIVHGMSEHLGRYDGFARYLVGRGFTVCASDHVGHGKSVPGPEKLGCLPAQGGKDVLIEDVHELRRTVAARYSRQTPYILFGHSMGSFVVRATWPATRGPGRGRHPAWHPRSAVGRAIRAPHSGVEGGLLERLPRRFGCRRLRQADRERPHAVRLAVHRPGRRGRHIADECGASLRGRLRHAHRPHGRGGHACLRGEGARGLPVLFGRRRGPGGQLRRHAAAEPRAARGRAWTRSYRACATRYQRARPRPGL
ncbi:MAG: alpha/beta fold hydrolase, partial [Gordonibacter urolithinfaciens]